MKIKYLMPLPHTAIYCRDRCNWCQTLSNFFSLGLLSRAILSFPKLRKRANPFENELSEIIKYTRLLLRTHVATYSSALMGLVVWSTSRCCSCCCFRVAGSRTTSSSSIGAKMSPEVSCFSSSSRSVNIDDGRMGAFGLMAVGSAGLAGLATTRRTWFPVPRRTAATRSLPTPCSQCSLIWRMRDKVEIRARTIWKMSSIGVSVDFSEKFSNQITLDKRTLASPCHRFENRKNVNEYDRFWGTKVKI